MTNYVLTENADDFPGPSDNSGDDSIDALGGNDTVAAGAGDDVVFGGAGDDVVYGYTEAFDTIGGGTVGGDDTLSGGEGADSLYGGGGNDTLEGGAGADFLYGGNGSNIATYVHSAAALTVNTSTDVHTGDAAGDTFLDIGRIELTLFDDTFVGGGGRGLGGNDTMSAGRFLGVTNDGGDGDDLLSGSSGTDYLWGQDGADTLKARGANDSLYGGAGADRISGGGDTDAIEGDEGNDVLSGDAGADDITGGLGADRISGGSGADRFRYDRAADSTAAAADLIRDLSNEDTIRLKPIDADATVAGDQAFHLVAALSGQAGELALQYNAGRNLTFLLGDQTGDGVADFVVAIAGDHTDFTSFNL